MKSGGTASVAFSRVIASYAARVAPTFGDSHHVGSALGAWLVLALAAPAATEPARDELERILGMTADEATAKATELLAEPPQAVAAAVALWTQQTPPNPALVAWQDGLSPAVERGPIPSQEAANAWTVERTLGLIHTFPLEMSPNVVLMLASVLATRVSWTVPFETVPADELGGAWGVERVLRSPERRHPALIAVDPEAGEVAVHVAESAEGLDVLSVIAAPDAHPATVLAAAHRVAIGWATGTLVQRSLFELPLGIGHAWTLTEAPVRTRAGREEVCQALLPAWSATSHHELLRDPATGFSVAGRALAGLLGPHATDVDARQAAMARYTRTGFEAAAVTALMVPTSLPPEGLRRTALLRFDRPYAVVATARQDGGPWHGVPVFSAWIAEADPL